MAVRMVRPQLGGAEHLEARSPDAVEGEDGGVGLSEHVLEGDL